MRTAILTLLGAFLFAPPAVAQDGFDAHGLHLIPHDGDIRDPLTFYRPGALHSGEWTFSGVFEYASRPLVQVISSDAQPRITEIPVIDDLLTLNVAAGVAPHERFRIDAFFPVYGFSTTGIDREFEGPTVGDVRVSTLVLLVRPDHVLDGGGFGLGVDAHVDIPSGDDERFLGGGGVGGGGGINATYEVEWFTASAMVGGQYRPAVDIDNFTGGPTLDAGLGINFALAQSTGVSLEMLRKTSLAKNDIEGAGSPGQAVLSLKYHAPSGLFLTFGGSAGLSRGIGSARYRALFGIGYGNMPPRRPADFDNVGTLQIADACPAGAETVNGWQDDDGCPDGLGTLTVSVELDGKQMPGANVDITGGTDDFTFVSQPGPEVFSDVMPEQVFSGSATLGRCLSGTGTTQATEGGSTLAIALERQLSAEITVKVWDPDGNPIPTARVVWRSEDAACVPVAGLEVDADGGAVARMGPGDAHLLVAAPEFKDHEADFVIQDRDKRVINVTLEPVVQKVVRVRLEKKRIVILEKVFFETAKARILPESFPLLNDVADTIITNPDVGRVEVAGHTDARGTEQYNQDLSQRRAESVRDYLVGRGVDPVRLLSIGYGEARPIADNDTDAGMEQNRRVEFNLVDQVDDEDQPQEAP